MRGAQRLDAQLSLAAELANYIRYFNRYVGDALGKSSNQAIGFQTKGNARVLEAEESFGG
jgi:hypothetical protein